MADLFALNDNFATYGNGATDLEPDDPINFQQRELAIARLTTGGFAVAWEAGFVPQPTEPPMVKMSRFDANGQRVGGVVTVSGNAYDPAIAGLTGGGTAVVWSAPDGSGLGVSLRLYGADGSPAGSVISVPTVIAQQQRQPSIASFADGRFVVVWTDGSTSIDDIKARLFDRNGAPLTGEITVSGTPNQSSTDAQVAVLANGSFAVSWTEGTGTTGNVLTRVFNGSGAAAGPSVTVEALGGYKSGLAALTGGGFVVGGTGNSGSVAQLFDAAGNKSGSAVSIPALVPSSLAARDEGGFVAAYTQSDGYRGFYTYLQIYDASGTPAGPRVQPGGGAEVISGFGTGDFAIAYQTIPSYNTPYYNPDAFVQLLFGAVAGTASADAMVGDATTSNYLRGLAGNDSLVGGVAADVLDGGPGADTMRGGDGDDTYYIDDSGDVVIDSAGHDIIITTASFTLTSGTAIEEVRAAGSAAINLIGNEIGQSIAGNEAPNLLVGGGGDDTLIGGGGDDTLDGGTGDDILNGNENDDTLNGGAGNDTLDGGTGIDRLAGGVGDDTYYVDDVGDIVVEAAGEGSDTVIVRAANYLLAAGVSVEVLRAAEYGPSSNIAGNELNQMIVGNAGDNILSGNGGDDTLDGGLGDDIYRVFSTATVILDSGGFDTVYASGTSYFLYSTAEIEYLSPAQQSATDPIYLVGNATAQVIVGNYGNNILNGRGGGNGNPDTLIGLLGDDQYGVFSQGDVVRENAGEGSDIVYANASYQLRNGTSVEALSTVDQSATTTIALTGNEVSQTLVGDNGANLLDGRGGNDTLIGLGGADTFAFSTALDAATNVDTIRDFVSGTDRIGLASDVFAVVTSGGILASEFVVGTAATTADTRLIYDQATGRLFYDADANGAGAAVQFAQLAAGTALTSADFTVVAPVANLAAA